jgi:hypothetical protein
VTTDDERSRAAATVGLFAFVEARLADEEAAFDRDAEAEAEQLRTDGLPATTADDVRRFWLEPSSVSHWPRRLAEVEAKRRILRIHEAAGLDCDYGAGSDDDPTVRAVAAVFADHPDYRREWTP